MRLKVRAKSATLSGVGNGPFRARHPKQRQPQIWPWRNGPFRESRALSAIFGVRKSRFFAIFADNAKSKFWAFSRIFAKKLKIWAWRCPKKARKSRPFLDNAKREFWPIFGWRAKFPLGVVLKWAKIGHFWPILGHFWAGPQPEHPLFGPFFSGEKMGRKVGALAGVNFQKLIFREIFPFLGFSPEKHQGLASWRATYVPWHD